MKRRSYKKNTNTLEKLRFLAADFDKYKKEKILNFSNLSNMARGTFFDSERMWHNKLTLLKLRAVEYAITFQQSMQSSRF